MAGRPREQLNEQDAIQIYEYLNDLEFLRVKEKKCLEMFLQVGFKNLNSEQEKLARDTRYLMNRALKNFNLLHEIQLQEKHSSTEKQILELCEKNDIDSYFSMHDLLDALRKKTDAKFAENKIKQKINAQSKEKSPKKIADQKKYFIGDLCLKWIESTFQNLSDDQVLDALNRMIENQKIGQEARKFWEQNNQNKDYLNTQIAATSQLKAQVNAAKTDSRNPFKK